MKLHHVLHSVAFIYTEALFLFLCECRTCFYHALPSHKLHLIHFGWQYPVSVLLCTTIIGHYLHATCLCNDVWTLLVHMLAEGNFLYVLLSCPTTLLFL